MRIDYTYTSLANGLRVLLHPDRSMPIVCINIGYHVGSKDEKPGKTGFAHLFEHLMFDGSVHVPRGAFDRYCEQAGGYNNAYTNEDKTNYYMVLPSNHLELGLWLESDRLLGLDLTEQGLETQRSVVMEEKRQRVDNQPYGTMEDRLAESCYSVHPYSHSVIGSMEDIAGATFEDVVAFHETFYKPNNAVLTLAGDFDSDEALRLIEKYFGGIPAGNSIPRIMVQEPPRTEETRLVIPDDVPLPGVFLAYNMCEERGADFISLDMFTDLLGYGESSRLYRSLVYEQNIANQAGAYVDVREQPGLLLIYAMGNPGVQHEQLVEALDSEITHALEQGMSDAELLRVKNKIESSYYQSMQSLTSRAERLTHFALLYDDPSLIERLIHDYLSVSADHILNVARTYIRPENRSVLQYVPRTSGQHPEMESEQ